MTKKPEALRLINSRKNAHLISWQANACAELRRLHEVNQELLKSLRLMNIDCQHLHHEYKDRHNLDVACPVVDRINTAIAKGEAA